MSFKALYQQKRMSAADAIRVVKNGDTIVVPTAVGEPPSLLTALSEARRDFRDVQISQILAVRKFGYLDPETVENVRHTAYFYSGATRPGAKEGWVDFIPAYFSEMPQMISRGLMPADVVFSMASPMDEHGFFSLALAADYTMAAIERARVVVLEVNPNVPFANGDCHIHISQVAALCESDEPILEVGLPKIGPVQEAIGKYVAEMIPDGATLQIGYGGIPDAVVMQLTDKRDLGIHTEMVGDGIMSLVEAGVVTNRKKNYHHGKMLATFALGSKKLYQFMHRNPALDFVRAANRSNGGKAFIVLPSTAKDDTISRIVPTLSAGTHVSTSKNDINYVVTEFGVAQLRGKTAKQRTEALIGIAHPNFRGELRDAAKRLKLL